MLLRTRPVTIVNAFEDTQTKTEKFTLASNWNLLHIAAMIYPKTCDLHLWTGEDTCWCHQYKNSFKRCTQLTVRNASFYILMMGARGEGRVMDWKLLTQCYQLPRSKWNSSTRLARNVVRSWKDNVHNSSWRHWMLAVTFTSVLDL